MWVKLTKKDGDVEYVNLAQCVRIESEALEEGDPDEKFTWIYASDDDIGMQGPYVEAPETFLKA